MLVLLARLQLEIPPLLQVADFIPARVSPLYTELALAVQTV